MSETTNATSQQPESTTPTAATPKVKPSYRLADTPVADFKPGRGLAAALLAEVTTAGPLTAEDAALRLLANGAYEKFAPQAAALRPVKPIAFWLREWTKVGVLTTAAPVAHESTDEPAPATDEPAPATDQPATDEPAADAAPAAEVKKSKKSKK